MLQFEDLGDNVLARRDIELGDDLLDPQQVLHRVDDHQRIGVRLRQHASGGPQHRREDRAHAIRAGVLQLEETLHHLILVLHLVERILADDRRHRLIQFLDPLADVLHVLGRGLGDDPIELGLRDQDDRAARAADDGGRSEPAAAPPAVLPGGRIRHREHGPEVAASARAATCPAEQQLQQLHDLGRRAVADLEDLGRELLGTRDVELADHRLDPHQIAHGVDDEEARRRLVGTDVAGVTDQRLNDLHYLGGGGVGQLEGPLDDLILVLNGGQRLIRRDHRHGPDPGVPHAFQIDRLIHVLGRIALQPQRPINLLQGLVSRQPPGRIDRDLLLHDVVRGDDHFARPVGDLLDDELHLHVFEVERLPRLGSHIEGVRLSNNLSGLLGRLRLVLLRRLRLRGCRGRAQASDWHLLKPASWLLPPLMLQPVESGCQSAFSGAQRPRPCGRWECSWEQPASSQAILAPRCMNPTRQTTRHTTTPTRTGRTHFRCCSCISSFFIKT